MTLLEYLLATQPEVTYRLLSKHSIRVVAKKVRVGKTLLDSYWCYIDARKEVGK